jgi:hypothetical protein
MADLRGLFIVECSAVRREERRHRRAKPALTDRIVRTFLVELLATVAEEDPARSPLHPKE